MGARAVGEKRSSGPYLRTGRRGRLRLLPRRSGLRLHDRSGAHHWSPSLAYGSAAFSQSTVTGGPTPSPPGAKVEFVDLKDGAIIGPKTTIHFGLHGMGVAPAGTKKANSGHHHLLIDADLP